MCGHIYVKLEQIIFLKQVYFQNLLRSPLLGWSVSLFGLSGGAFVERISVGHQLLYLQEALTVRVETVFLESIEI